MTTVEAPYRELAARTVAEVIRRHARRRPTSKALIYGDGRILTYATLQEQIERTANDLFKAGVVPGDRVGIILADSAQLAATMTAVACYTTALPLNSGLTASELQAFYSRASIRAIVLSAAERGGRQVAMAAGILVLTLEELPDRRGFSLHSDDHTTFSQQQREILVAPAFILRTSGTTAESKLVPVSHENLLVTAEAVRSWFGLTAEDRVLCTMPLYFSVGLKVSLFTSLIVGGSVVAAPADRDYLRAIEMLSPTWYSGGPAIHQAIVERAKERNVTHSLRFIHSGAAALPERLRQELEAVFGVSVLQTYGLSEVGLVAANSNALGGRKPGTVGQRRPGELEIRALDGRIVSGEELGEVVVRGPAVMSGYLDDDSANGAAFVDGWFRTGDMGRIDKSGFLVLAGRIKELINRGGEKIAPAEVDDALLRHPAVGEACAFAVPHPRLGEDVAAAVVLRPNQNATSLLLRKFLRGHLTIGKIPRRIFVLDQFPKGETGKVRRYEIAQLCMSVPMDDEMTDWASPLEIQIADIWKRLLHNEQVGRDDEFFELGGDSLLATQMLLEIENLTGRIVPSEILFETATVRQLAAAITQTEIKAEGQLLIEIRGSGAHPPLIFIDGDFWGGGYYTRAISELLGPDWPFFQLRSHAMRDYEISSIQDMAGDYMNLILNKIPEGPYRIAGHCNGALVALELARQLELIGKEVQLLVLIEPITLNARKAMRALARTVDVVVGVVRPIVGERLKRAVMAFLWRAVRKVASRLQQQTPELTAKKIAKSDRRAAARYVHLQREFLRSMACYVPLPVSAKVLYLVTKNHQRKFEFTCDPMFPLSSDKEIVTVPGEHMTCITTYASGLVAVIRDRLMQMDRDKDV